MPRILHEYKGYRIAIYSPNDTSPSSARREATG